MMDSGKFLCRITYGPDDTPEYLAHELGHFIDDCTPITGTNERTSNRMGTHHLNPLWMLITEVIRELRHCEYAYINDMISDYSPSRQQGEYFAYAGEIHRIPDSAPTGTLSKATQQYMKSIVDLDAAICVQKKSFEEIINDRKQFQSIIGSAIDDSFRQKALGLAKSGQETTVTTLLKDKMTQIARSAKRTFKIKTAPARGET